MLIVAVVGPTATGKSDLALDLVEALAASRGDLPHPEVVNADAYQLYRGMDVGTAKVRLEDRREIPHHQLDVLDVQQDASVAAYQSHARADVAELLARRARPIVVGGSGLYLRALLDDMRFPGTDPVLREALEARAEAEGARRLYEELERLDPVAAAAIEPRNARRVVRALEVIELTGAPYSANLPRQEYVAPTVQIGLDIDRQLLDERAQARVDVMWDRGLVDEVAALAEVGLGRTAARAVGYAEVLRHLSGEISEDDARREVVASTRRLARKQMGWFGRDPRVHWLRAESGTLVADALEVVAAADQGLAPAPADGPVRRSLGS